MADETRDPASADLAAMPSPDPRVPSLHELAAQVTDLRPLPAVVPRILEITEGERFSAHELATLIANDQALTARLLRLANSAYYGFARRITTVRDAVVLIGFRAVRSATLVSCVMTTMDEGENLDRDVFWHYSLSVGTLAELLAKTEGAHQDQAFTAGVLHNIGLLALDEQRPDLLGEALTAAASRDVGRHEAERDLWGFTDADLGGALAERWQFPPPLVEAVREHARPLDRLPEPTSLASFVIRARLFARAYGIEDGVGWTEPVETAEVPAAWSLHPLSAAVRHAGGVEAVRTRAEAFLEAAV